MKPCEVFDYIYEGIQRTGFSMAVHELLTHKLQDVFSIDIFGRKNKMITRLTIRNFTNVADHLEQIQAMVKDSWISAYRIDDYTLILEETEERNEKRLESN